MKIEEEVAHHYSRSELEKTIVDALRAAGKNVDRLTAADLSGADEFHLGWLPATAELAKDLGLDQAMHVLDVGCGIGGPARYFADAIGCRVTGIDLTEDFIRAAEGLTRRCGLSNRIAFRQGSALAMPFQNNEFDAATLIHVGMNIGDKRGLFSEIRRVLKSGARLGVYDVMRTAERELPYPMPWAATAATSFVDAPETYRDLLAASGFVVEAEHNRREFVRALASGMRDSAAKNGAPPIGLHLLMGPATRERLANVMASLEGGTIAPVEMIARAV